MRNRKIHFGACGLLALAFVVCSLACNDGTSDGSAESDTDADTNECRDDPPPIPPLVDAPFELVVPDQTSWRGETVTFTVRATGDANVDDYDIEWEVDAEGPDPDGLEGATVSHAYTVPRRARIEAWLTNKNDPSDKIVLLNYHNVARPFEETVYATRNNPGALAYQRTDKLKEGDGSTYCGYHYYVYQGKYYEGWIQQDHPDKMTDASILEMVAQADLIFETYANEMFGWDLMTGYKGMKIAQCQDLSGAGGGGGGGVFFGGSSGGGNMWSTLTHELIHEWGMRNTWLSPSFVQSHSLTNTLQYYVGSVVGAPHFTRRKYFMPMSAGALAGRLERAGLKHYLADDYFNWENTFGQAVFEMDRDLVDHPQRNMNSMGVGSLWLAIARLHGLAGLKAYFQQFDWLMIQNWRDDWYSYNMPMAERTENMLMNLARSVRLDVSGYFDHWKFPVSDENRALLASKYPQSPKVRDQDGDGFSPVQGDYDDCDNTVYPFAPELKDGKDNNCEGLVDEEVADENVIGDVDELTITIPAYIRGSIPDENDEDVFRFTTPAGKLYAVYFITMESENTIDLAPGDSRKLRGFSGTYYVGNSGHYAHNGDLLWLYDMKEGNGNETTIKINSDTPSDRTFNPGNYEIRVVVEEDEGVNLDLRDEEKIIQILYP